MYIASGISQVVDSQLRDAPSTLKMRNVCTGSRRTSVRLEPELWQALEALAAAAGRSINDLCEALDEKRGAQGLTSALRVYIVTELAKRGAIAI